MPSTKLLVVFALLLCSSAWADPRPFTFTYDTYPEGKGNVEYEQWVTFGHHTREDHDFTRIDFRHEFEIGITDNFDLSIYLPNWFCEDTPEHTGTRFDTVSVEGIFYVMNPVKDAFGLGLYLEIAAGEDELEFEPKLLLQKDIGSWTLAYNLIVETELEGIFKGGEDVVEGIVGHALGASYSLGRDWRLGAEMTVESIFEDWTDYDHTTVYAGPVIGYSSPLTIPGTKAGWWVTVTPAFQLTDIDNEPEFLVRMLAGIEF